MKNLLLGLVALLLPGCTGIPQNIKPVGDFNVNRYLGSWYEIARLDHPFEKGLDNVRAEYRRRDNGGIDVINSGYFREKEIWKSAQGKAYFVRDKKTGHLKVSFFGPFYSSYVIFELEQENYNYAFVCGYNTSYLWLLSRTPSVDHRVRQKFIEKAKEYGFDTDKLIFISHDREMDEPSPT